MKVLGISGSLRQESYNTSLLRAAAELIGEDIEFELWQGSKAVPPYDADEDTENPPAAVAAMRSAAFVATVTIHPSRRSSRISVVGDDISTRRVPSGDHAGAPRTVKSPAVTFVACFEETSTTHV